MQEMEEGGKSQEVTKSHFLPSRTQKLKLSLRRVIVWLLFFTFVIVEAIILNALATLNVLDAQLAYAPPKAITLIKTLKSSELSAYRLFNKFDFVLIFLYSILLVAWFKLLEPDAGVKIKGWPWLGLLPGIFDLLENIGVALLLYSKQPEKSVGVWMAVAGTPLKWGSTVLILLLLLFAEIRGLRRRLKEGRPWYDLS